MAKSNETKVGDKLAEGLNDYTFSPAILANYLITNYPTYTFDRLMELVRYIIQYGTLHMRVEWGEGFTSEGLLMADTLNDILETKYGRVEIDLAQYEDKRTRDPRYDMLNPYVNNYNSK